MEEQKGNFLPRKSISLSGNEYIQAKKEMEQGNYEMSLVMINLAIDKFEKSIYYFFRGNVYEKLSKIEECYQDYKKAKELNTTDYTYYENLGRICRDLGKFEEAIENYTQIIESGSVNDDDNILAFYHYEIGSIYDSLHKHKESYGFYLQAIDLDNKNAVNYQYKGNYLHQCNEFKSKLHQLLESSYYYDVNSSKVFTENDNEKPSLNPSNQKILEEKILTLKKELEAKPFEKSIWDKLAKSLKEAKRFEEAVVYFEKCYDKQKKNKLYLINLADCYLKLKNYKKSIFYSDRLIEIDSNYFKTYKIRSIANYEIGEMDKALNDIEKAIKIQPDNYFSKEFEKKIRYNLDTKSE